ncbi:MAG: hypothetical protein JNJ91_12905 [Flavobacteriales bacterium]|nr:hypothetical protein [Flavobacteriales bacterium]
MEGGTTLILHGEVVGLSITTDGERPVLHYVRLKRTRREVRIVAMGEAEDVAALKKACGTRAPVALVVHTARALHRVVPAQGDLVTLLAQGFPGAPLEQLLASGWRHGNAAGLSMMRRSAMAVMNDELRAAGYRIVARSIGPWGLLHLAPLLGKNGEEVSIGRHRFQLEAGSLTGYLEEDTTALAVEIGDDRIPDTHLLAYAAAWEQLVPTAQRLQLADDGIRQDQREERMRLWYERGLVAVAVVLLLMLGTHVLVEADLRTANAASGASQGERQAISERIEGLRAEVSTRTELATQLGLGRKELLAARAMRILGDVPSGILLDRVSIDPLRAGLRERERPAVDVQRIRVIGTCTDGQVLNAWMHEIRQLPGVRNVQLSGYVTDARTPRPTFTLDLET